MTKTGNMREQAQAEALLEAAVAHVAESERPALKAEILKLSLRFGRLLKPGGQSMTRDDDDERVPSMSIADMSVAEIQAHLVELERKGMVRWTGEFRDGWPVYVALAPDEIARLRQGERDN